ncbi:MAG: hypothetical protein ABJK83_00190, partial [Parasphingorhabdus sp.]|uniref:hypothetical protein n=1 Tax=Parasphingorhabdus sp. TaxID=2709688 RepID=UPI003297330C
ALAGVLAIMDRDTAWAPDGLTIPMTVLAFVMGSVNYGTMPFFTAIIASLVVFGVGQGLWWLQCRFELIVLPPADFLAFIIPAALLGVSFSLVIFYITTASLILILRKFPYFAPIFSHQQAVDEAAIDLGFGDKPAVTFLAVAFPILFGIIFVSSVFSY